jgi:hypothetical protein
MRTIKQLPQVLIEPEDYAFLRDTCTLLTASCNRLPQYTWIWVETPCCLRQVLDTGAHFNDDAADDRDCDLWCDLWMTREMDTHVTRYAVIGKD